MSVTKQSITILSCILSTIYVCLSVFVPLDEVLHKPSRPVCFESKHENSPAIHDPQENTQVCVSVCFIRSDRKTEMRKGKIRTQKQDPEAVHFCIYKMNILKTAGNNKPHLQIGKEFMFLQ